MNKKIIPVFIILLIIVIIVGFTIIRRVKNIEKEEIIQEYTPQEEIGNNQVRQTIVNLYFVSSKSNELVPEARLIDIKEIINNPSEKIINLLMEGPKNENNTKLIPNNTKLNRIYYEGDCVVIDFSNEFLDFNKEDEKQKEQLINSLVKSLTQFTEINRIRILINGQENEEFNQIYNN